MANSEDYLDGLLDSIAEAKSNSIAERKSNLDRRERETARMANIFADDDFLMANGLNDYRPDNDSMRTGMRRSLSESDFLREFEDEIDFEDTSAFLEEFEKELFAEEGIEVSDSWIEQRENEKKLRESDDLNVISLNREVDDKKEEPDTAIEPEASIEPEEIEEPAEPEDSEEVFEDDLMAGLGSILEDEASVEEAPSEEAPSEETPAEETPSEEAPAEDEIIIPEDSGDEDAGDALLDDLNALLDAADDEDMPFLDPDAPVSPPEGEASDGDIDLLELLNAADAADGDIEAPADGGAPADGASSGASGALGGASAEAGEEEEESEGKKGFLAKILGIFKKKKKSDDDEEEESEGSEGDEVDDALVAAGLVEGEEAPKGKKGKKEKLSKEEKKALKEQKKKEKADAKAAKAKEKEAKKAAKPPKEKKPKKQREPDTSPKIPLKIIILFIILAGSMVALVLIGKKVITYPMQISAAKSAYDHKNFLEAYNEISGVNIKEDDTFLAVRIEMMATLENKYTQYENAIKAPRGDYLTALDALIQGEGYYVKHEKEARDVYDIANDFDEKGLMFRTQLNDLFGIDEAKSKELYSIRSRKDYTQQLYLVLRDQGLMEF